MDRAHQHPAHPCDLSLSVHAGRLPAATWHLFTEGSPPGLERPLCPCAEHKAGWMC